MSWTTQINISKYLIPVYTLNKLPTSSEELYQIDEDKLVRLNDERVSNLRRILSEFEFCQGYLKELYETSS